MRATTVIAAGVAFALLLVALCWGDVQMRRTKVVSQCIEKYTPEQCKGLFP